MVVNIIGGQQFYMDGWLYAQCLKLRELIRKGDDDYVFVVSGDHKAENPATRIGKSVFAFQLAKALDPTFGGPDGKDLSRCVFRADSFAECIDNNNKFTATVYDEALNGVDSRSSMTAENKKLRQIFFQMGQKNLFIILVIPLFSHLDYYLALNRSNALFEIYKHNEGDRVVKGFWRVYQRKQKSLLFNKLKLRDSRLKHMNIYSDRQGRFTKYSVLDEELYREKKRIEFKKLFEEQKPVRAFELRNKMIKLCMGETDWTQQELSDKMSRYGIDLSNKQISMIVKDH